MASLKAAGFMTQRNNPAPGLGADLSGAQQGSHLSLDEEMEIGARELMVDALQECVRVGSLLLMGGGGTRPRAVFRGEGEGERAGVEEPVGPHQAHRHCDGSAQPAPITAEGGHIRHHAHQGPRAPGGGAWRLGLGLR